MRHGVTPANVENRFAGRSGEELHPDGVVQIRQVAEKLKPHGISAIYCGPLMRTRQSAAILAEALNVSVIPVDGFTEIDLPHWDGFTKDEIRARYGDQYPAWLATPHLFQVEGCETIGDVQLRAVAALRQMVAEQAGRAVVVVSHLIVLRAIMLFYRNLPITDFRSIKISNGDLLRVQL